MRARIATERNKQRTELVPTTTRLGEIAAATNEEEETEEFVEGATGMEDSDGDDLISPTTTTQPSFYAAAAAAAVNNDNDGTETTQNQKRKREDHLNFDADVSLPQVQAIMRDDDEDDDDDEEEEEEEEDNEEETEEGNGSDGGDDDNDEEEEEDGDNDEDDEEDDDHDDSDEEVESVVPAPDDVELEYTYPDDFEGSRSWRDVVADGQYFRLILNPSCIEIAADFFFRCTLLIDVVFRGNKLTRIRQRAFMCCWNLQRINAFPKRLKYLEEMAFINCGALEIHLVIPKGCVLVGQSCFQACSLKSVVFEEPSSPERILEIHVWAFCECHLLRSVRLPKNLRVIPAGCFSRCFELIDIPLPQGVLQIESRSFLYCTKLTSIDLPESIHLLGANAYSACKSLESITIRCASSNIEIGRNVFLGCSAVSTIRMYPWLYPKLFRAMQYHPHKFLYTFVRESQYQLERYRLYQSR